MRRSIPRQLCGYKRTGLHAVDVVVEHALVLCGLAHKQSSEHTKEGCCAIGKTIVMVITGCGKNKQTYEISPRFVINEH